MSATAIAHNSAKNRLLSNSRLLSAFGREGITAVGVGKNECNIVEHAAVVEHDGISRSMYSGEPESTEQIGVRNTTHEINELTTDGEVAGSEVWGVVWAKQGVQGFVQDSDSNRIGNSIGSSICNSLQQVEAEAEAEAEVEAEAEAEVEAEAETKGEKEREEGRDTQRETEEAEEVDVYSQHPLRFFRNTSFAMAAAFTWCVYVYAYVYACVCVCLVCVWCVFGVCVWCVCVCVILRSLIFSCIPLFHVRFVLAVHTSLLSDLLLSDLLLSDLLLSDLLLSDLLLSDLLLSDLLLSVNIL